MRCVGGHRERRLTAGGSIETERLPREQARNRMLPSLLMLFPSSIRTPDTGGESHHRVGLALAAASEGPKDPGQAPAGDGVGLRLCWSLL